MFYSWLHLIALVVYLGAVIGFWLMLLPAVALLEKHDEKVRYFARGLKFYNPLQVGSLGIILFTGAFQLTELKAAYRETFINYLAYNLSIKLLFAFLLVIFSVYQALGIGHRFVRRTEGGDPVTPEQLRSIISRMTGANWCILLFAAITLWLGLRLQT
ncbi:MAG TPA: hypothetical protein VFQ89_12580 [Candidatus Binatia bacterium]|nr:hypothetical protein [Candidatus Binatia bacterium]